MLARTPRSSIRATSHSTALRSWRETLGIATSPRTSSMSGLTVVIRSDGEDLRRRREDAIDLFRGDDEGRQVANDGRTRAEDEDAFVLHRLDGRTRVLLEVDADEEPETANL